MKKYRKPILIVVSLVYAIAAIVRPDLMLPSEESIFSILDAIFGALPEGTSE